MITLNNTTTKPLKTNKIMETPFLLMTLVFSTLYVVVELNDKFKKK
jgi:hypothetical protein